MKWGVRRTPEQLGHQSKTNRKFIADSHVVEHAISSGKVSKEVNCDKQERHIKGSNAYIFGRSYIDGDLSDAQNIINDLSCTGTPIMNSKGDWTNKERVRSSKEIGVHISPDDGSETRTKSAIIVYSKSGSHIIPGKDDTK